MNSHEQDNQILQQPATCERSNCERVSAGFDINWNRLWCVAILAGILATSTGCAAVDSGKSAFFDMTHMMRPRPFDGPARTAPEEDEWGFVGDEGRADQDREYDKDRWYRNLIMSPEARNIEKNLGID